MGSGINKDIVVSIIIVNYNSFDLLNQCLESIINFTEEIRHEIIVVDNNSNEDGLDKIISKFSGIKFVRNKENIGFAKANNIGLTYASGKYILFLNNDTYFIENSLKQLLEFAEDVKNDVFIGCRLLNKDGSRQISLVDFDTLLNSFGENFFLYKLFPKSKTLNRYHFNYKNLDSPIEVDIIKGAFMFCSARPVRRLGGFDSRFFFYGEESDLCRRFKNNGGKIFYFPGTRIYHVGGATTKKYQWLKFKNQNLSKIKKYQKHYHGFEFFTLILFHYMGLILRIPVYIISGLFLFDKNRLVQAFYYFKSLFVYPRNEFV